LRAAGRQRRADEKQGRRIMSTFAQAAVLAVLRQRRWSKANSVPTRWCNAICPAFFSYTGPQQSPIVPADFDSN
jgi:hypothetical protein